MPKRTDTELSPRPYVESGNIEAHIIADMLRIESITAELREFKETTKGRLDKLESWIIAIVGLTFTTLMTTVVGLLMKVL
ncbi:hypothetical protein N9C44_00120 [bacterium]|jgi:hypothetical protein|nr:hypothetical protein [bacterium]|tara:strand:- start:195 stop:434 length:240 start_codon:yes stop_codon:yes gene_type:complete